MPEQRTFYLDTLGCKVNQYETQALREAWQGLGFAECPTPENSSLLIVHSCAVTANALSDVRAHIRRLHRANPDAAIMVMGCAAEVCGSDLIGLPGVVRIVSRAAKADFILTGPDSKNDCLPGQVAEPVFPPLCISGYTRARPVIKCQDGCSHGCTYCIVPLARGRSVSRPPEDILAEMRRLHEAGFAELIISGINLRQYGRDFPKAAPIRNFWDLLAWLENELVQDWAGQARWRLSSLEPGQLAEQALDTLGQSRLIAPHLHISLQSGSPTVLRRMGRGHYAPEMLGDFLGNLRRAWPVMGLGADILMGFPGESEAEFEETRLFIQALPLTYAHVFPFSVRPGTKAATLPDHLPRQVKDTRAALIRSLAEAKKSAFLHALIQRSAADPAASLKMVLESRDRRLGVSEYYASCCLAEAGRPLGALLTPGALVTVRPVSIADGVLQVVQAG